MLTWFLSLPEDLRAFLVGVLAERLTQLVKLALSRAGLLFDENKVSKLVLAAVTSAALALASTQAGPAFWREWLTAFVAAVAVHEVGGKVLRAARKQPPA